MTDKLIEAIARWLCEERDPGIMQNDPGYWTRYKPEAMELIAALARVGLAVAENAKLIDAVLEQADADSYAVEAEFSAGSDEQYEKERAAIAHVRTMLLSALPKPGGE